MMKNRLAFIVLGGIVIFGSLGYLLFQVLFSGSTAQNPDNHSGEIIVNPATYNLPEVGGIKNFSVSPDGKWLFITADDNPGAHQYDRYILHNIETGQGTFINNDQNVIPETFFDPKYPRQKPGCWDPDSKKVILIGADLSTLYFLPTDSSSPTWQSQENTGGLYSYYDNCPTQKAPYEISTMVEINQLSDRSIELTTAQNPKRILAKLTSGAITVSRVAVNSMVISPDGQYISYIFDQHRGSFVAPSQGYVLSLQGEPRLRLLGSPVYEPFQWSSDSKYVYARTKGDKGQSIYRWKIQD